VHFQILGRDAGKLRSYYSALCGWEFDVDEQLGYGVVSWEKNKAPNGMGIGGGIGSGPDGYEGHVTFYIAVPDVEAALAKAESLGGRRVMGPHRVNDQIEIGQFTDPEGHLVGFVNPTM
jgi:predicted enzyme related to lactoylglutathione lyase